MKRPIKPSKLARRRKPPVQLSPEQAHSFQQALLDTVARRAAGRG